MVSFNKRLHWNGHFIQRLELQPSIEFQNMARAADGLREDEHSEERLDAWCRGATGYPMVDACMRYLHTHRWINFRMRAMLVSFAAYHLWLDWRRFSHYLARHFIDYEPGIHYSQLQMQSGTTGINAVRIYSPTKQGRDHDPEGQFIRRWLPELVDVPTAFIHEPWTMSLEDQYASGCRIGSAYPRPLVDHKEAVAYAKHRVHSARQGQSARDEAQAVYQRHGSRRRPHRTQAQKGSKPTSKDARP
jgi:deoxyribodipyrimidine photo-lyase